jgi:phenylalanyl-tRNA synthetase alpha chain
VTSDPANNISARVAEKVGRQLHLMRRHPLNTIKTKIEAHFAARAAALSMPSPFTVFDRLDPIVTTKANFDDLLVAPDHISRARSDTYYIDGGRVLRTHTSAHQSSLIGAGHHAFLCTGDVYRRDEIDASHYPVFHQVLCYGGF